MKREQRNSMKRRVAFTIVELLTVMGVIALLIGLLAPALNAVRRVARDTKQKAQFNSIKAGLEMFKTDSGDYPESTALTGTVGQTGIDATTNVITGSQRLAEAMLGRDLQGFDPVSRWHPDLDTGGTTPSNAYSTNTGGTPSEQQKSIDRRRSPYLDLENVGAFNIDQLYPPYGSTPIYGQTDTLNPTSGNNKPAPFITDVYTDRTITVEFTTTSGTSAKYVRVGTPVLYYKANLTNKSLKRDPAYPPVAPLYGDCTYNYYDNDDVLDLGKMSAWNGSNPLVGTPSFHPMANNANSYEKFYETITNHQIPSQAGVAYRQDTYILMSAGRDGLFGTTDDIYNFGD